MSQQNPECSVTRQTIDESAYWINNIDIHLDPEDEGYEDQQEGLNNSLEAATRAFDSKPAGCQMERSNDSFECRFCKFYVEIV